MAKIVFSSFLQIVLNNLLEDQIAEERVNKKDKAGNGLKCKNRAKTSPIHPETFQPDADFQINQAQPRPSGAINFVESQFRSDMARKVKIEKVICSIYDENLQISPSSKSFFLN